tara:strand:- start:6592 stop:7266 length:675 start_codon:yes stop_codon:yes gene_type:complete
MKNKSYRKKTKVIVIGNSNKFIKIIKSIYKNSLIKVYSWRSISSLNLNREKLFKNPNLILISGYNYKSQWYSYKKYYYSNISAPLKFIKFLANSNTCILYLDTINKIFYHPQRRNRNTFSRYEFAKKELGYKLKQSFRNTKILEIAPLTSINKPLIHGGFLTKMIFSALINLNLIKTEDIKKLKQKMILKIKSKEKNNPINLKPVLLKIPRSLFLDRVLRIIFD